jgi:hypothetical protein
MEMIIDDGKTVICPECFAHLRLDEPVAEGQEIQCHQCRLLIVIVREDGKLVPKARPADDAEEDTTW